MAEWLSLERTSHQTLGCAKLRAGKFHIPIYAVTKPQAHLQLGINVPYLVHIYSQSHHQAACRLPRQLPWQSERSNSIGHCSKTIQFARPPILYHPFSHVISRQGQSYIKRKNDRERRARWIRRLTKARDCHVFTLLFNKD